MMGSGNGGGRWWVMELTEEDVKNTVSRVYCMREESTYNKKEEIKCMHTQKNSIVENIH